MARGTGPMSRRAVLKALAVPTIASWFGTTSAVSRVPFSAASGSEPIRVTVGYSDASTGQAILDRAQEVIYKFGFDAVTVDIDRNGIEAIRALDDVRYVERDGIYVISSQTLPWGVDRVDADVAQANGHSGKGADIAIVDTGIDRGHPDLAANLGKGTAFQGGTQHNQWQDDNGHGTQCAGIAAAIDNDTGVVGVASNSTLHAVKVMSTPGAGLSSDVAKGIEWVANQGYDVCNLSIGGDHLEAVADACEYAATNGVTLVAAAGNNGPCRDCVEYPAAYPEVIAVSSTTRNDSLATSSSQGPEIELAAPGENIRSTYLGGYATRSGTSMACPHVAGAAAQLATSGGSNGGIRDTLKRSAEDIGLSSNESGAGLLDVAAAHDSGSAGGTKSRSSSSPSSQSSTPSASRSATTSTPPSTTGPETAANTATDTSRTGPGGTRSTPAPQDRHTTPTRGSSGPNGLIDVFVAVWRGLIDAFDAVTSGLSRLVGSLGP